MIYSLLVKKLIMVAVLLCLPAATAGAAGSGHIEITALEIRATPPGMTATGGYLSITNNSDKDERLIFVRAPFAAKSEIHTMIHDDGVTKMRKLTDGLSVGAGETVVMAPGGLHLMFMGMTAPLTPGQIHNVTLEFASGAILRVMGAVKKPADIGGAAGQTHDHKHDHKHDLHMNTPKLIHYCTRNCG